MIKTFWLASFGAFLFFLTGTGAARGYIHPKFDGYLVFLGIALLVMAVRRGTRLLSASPPPVRPSLLLFFVPLVLVSAFPYSSLEQNILKNRGAVLSPGGTTGVSAVTNADARGTSANPRVPAGNGSAGGNTEATGDVAVASRAQKSGEEAIGAGIDPEKRVDIRVSSNNFRKTLDMLYEKPGDAAGKRIRINGFAFTPEDFPPGRFVIARLAIYCCAADATVIGLPCLAGNIARVKDEDWYRVEGTIETIAYKNETLPAIRVERIDKIKAPKDKYVY
jgi:putative membrane protein